MAARSTAKAGSVAVEALAQFGVRRFYTVPGESFLELLDAVEAHPDLSLVSARHESGAAFMAEADAKLTGVPAVAMATRGVGASNLAIGVHTARQDSTPMLVLLGQVETSFLGREAFQEVNLPNFYAGITKWSATVHRADRLAEFVARGLRIATSGRPGPVMLAVPADLLSEEVPVLDGKAEVATLLDSIPSDEKVGEIARRIVGARYPVLIVGGGVRDARKELIDFAEAYNVGVYTGFRRQDAFPNDHPHYLGHLALGTPPSMLKALEEADLIFVLGCRLGEITAQSYTVPRIDQAVIQVDVEPSEVGAVVPVECGIVADTRGTLTALNAGAPTACPERDWDEAHRTFLDFVRIPPNSRAAEGLELKELHLAAWRKQNRQESH